jgi:hypothetical protein
VRFIAGCYFSTLLTLSILNINLNLQIRSKAIIGYRYSCVLLGGRLQTEKAFNIRLFVCNYAVGLFVIFEINLF